MTSDRADLLLVLSYMCTVSESAVRRLPCVGISSRWYLHLTALEAKQMHPMID